MELLNDDGQDDYEALTRRERDSLPPQPSETTSFSQSLESRCRVSPAFS